MEPVICRESDFRLWKVGTRGVKRGAWRIARYFQRIPWAANDPMTWATPVTVNFRVPFSAISHRAHWPLGQGFHVQLTPLPQQKAMKRYECTAARFHANLSY
jgi:hypothetical protein